MKGRGLVCLVLLLLVVGVVMAQAFVNDSDKAQEDYERIQDGIETVEGIYDPGTGEFNQTSVFWGVSEAEKNIEEINEWLDSNVAWLQFLLRMVPEISWLFLFNILFILTGFVHLGLNAAKYGFIAEEWLARVAGFSLFVILLVTNVYVSLAQIVVNVLDVFFNTLLPWGIAIAVIIMIVVILVFVALVIFAPQVLFFIWKFIAPLVGKKAVGSGVERVTAKAEKELAEVKAERENIEKFTDGAGI